MQAYERLAEVVNPEPLPAPASNDPDDDHVLACALAAKAEFIVSGDKRHLLVLGDYQGIPIRTVSDALSGLTATLAHSECPADRQVTARCGRSYGALNPPVGGHWQMATALLAGTSRASSVLLRAYGSSGCQSLDLRSPVLPYLP